MSEVRGPLAGRGTRVLVLAAVSVGLLAGCGSSDDDTATSGTAAASAKKSLKLVVPPHAGAAPVFIAEKEGYFTDEGLEVSIEPPASPSATFPALATGEIDALSVSIQSGATVVANGQPFKLIAQQAVGAPNYTGVVSNQPDIKTGADLEGKKVGVQVEGAACDLGAKAVMKSQGVDPTKITWVELPRESHGAAMERGDIDAVCAAEPMITQLKQEQPGTHLVVDSLTGPYDKILLDGYYMRDDFVEENPETVAAFRRALAKGMKVAQADEAQLRATIVEMTGLPPELVKEMALPSWGAQVEADPAEVQRVIDSMQEEGALPKPLKADELVASQ